MMLGLRLSRRTAWIAAAALHHPRQALRLGHPHQQHLRVDLDQVERMA
jgi:hypothetical protein